MRKRTFVATAAGSALIIAGGLTAALIATSSAAPPPTATAHFTAHYVVDGVDQWTCSGRHVISQGDRAKDTETCLITGDTTGYATMVGTFTGHPNASLPRGGAHPWHSDYNRAVATSFTITIKDAGHLDSKGFETYQADITAFYNS